MITAPDTCKTVVCEPRFCKAHLLPRQASEEVAMAPLHGQGSRGTWHRLAGPGPRDGGEQGGVCGSVSVPRPHHTDSSILPSVLWSLF